MALKKKITKAEFEKLNDAFKAEYIEDGDGYRLDVDGEEDTGALKRAKDREAQLRKEAEARAKAAEDRLAELDTNDARKKGDIETLEAKWKSDLQAEREGRKTDTEKLRGIITKNLADTTAERIASEIAKAPKVFARVVRDRLSVDFDGDEPVLKVLDASGKPTALTVDDLRKELVANPDYKDIIVASKASGGAGSASKMGGGAAQHGQQQPGDKPADLASMNPRALAEHLKSKAAQNEA